MFLKSKWRNLSIKKKIFLWSSLIIIISFTLLYICMYFFMPRVYEVYKVNNINEKIRELKSQLEKDENIDINELLDEFSYKNNLDILLVSKDENNLINKIMYNMNDLKVFRNIVMILIWVVVLQQINLCMD